MKEKLVTHINSSARPSEALPIFIPDKSILFMESWRSERAISVGKFAPNKPSEFFDGCPSFTIINHDRDGKERLDLSRTRFDTNHPACPKDEHGKPKKYKLNGAPGFSPVFAPLPDSYTKFASAKVKWIAEGEGGTLALAQLGLPVLGIGGCQNWRTKGTENLSADLDDIKAGDTVMIAGDGDVRTNFDVRKGYGSLMYAIRMRGAIPQYVLTPEDSGKKDGIDDVLARCKDPAAELGKLRKLSDLRSLDDFVLTTYEDLIGRPFPEWIVDGLVQPGELTAIVGETSCGKSFLVQDLMSSVARGLPKWFGKDINANGLVVHINFEGKGLGTRMKAYSQHHAIKGSFPYFALEQSVILPDENETDRLIRSIKNKSFAAGLPVVLIAVDTVNRALGGGDENSSADMGIFIRAADKIRDAFPAAGILLIHHLGKDSRKGARGHSSFSAAVGGELLVENNGGTRTVSITKQRDGTTEGDIHFILEVVTVGKNSKGVDQTSCVVNQVDRGSKTDEQDLTDSRVYGHIYMWNLNENGGRHTSRRQLMANKVRILPKGSKMNKPEFAAAIEGAVNCGLMVEHARAQGGTQLELSAPKQSKY